MIDYGQKEYLVTMLQESTRTFGTRRSNSCPGGSIRAGLLCSSQGVTSGHFLATWLAPTATRLGMMGLPWQMDTNSLNTVAWNSSK